MQNRALAVADVVVVGGGISGWSTAYELRKRGFNVVVLEQRFHAYGASGRNPGALWMQLRRTGYELDLARRGARKYEDFVAEYGKVFGHRKEGGLFYFETEEQRAVMLDYVDDRRAAGLDVELLDRNEALKVAETLPATALGAVYCADDSQVDSSGFVKALAAQCVAMGVAKFENTTALSTLRRGDEVYGVRTVRGDVHAAGVVWATGAWSVNLATEGLLLPVATARTGHMSTQPTTLQGHAVLHGPRGVAMCGALSDLPSFRSDLFAGPGLPAGELADFDDVVARTNEGGLFIGSSVDGRGSMNPHISIAATFAMTSAALDRYPDGAELGVTGLWAGLTVETSDGLPLVDRVDGVYVNTGHAWGIASGPVCGELTAQLIAGEPTALGAALHLDRPGLVPPA